MCAQATADDPALAVRTTSPPALVGAGPDVHDVGNSPPVERLWSPTRLWNGVERVETLSRMALELGARSGTGRSDWASKGVRGLADFLARGRRSEITPPPSSDDRPDELSDPEEPKDLNGDDDTAGPTHGWLRGTVHTLTYVVEIGCGGNLLGNYQYLGSSPSLAILSRLRC
jgi:hypothetical protein